MILSAAVIVVAGVTAGGGLIANYEPLRGDSLGSDIQYQYAHDLGRHTSPRGESFSAVGFECREGQRPRIGFTLLNEGPVGVTILGIGGREDPEFEPMRFTGRAWMGPLDSPYRYAISHAISFEQFSLGPGDHRFVVVEAEFTRCGPGIGIYGVQPVTFRVLGFERHTEVFTPYTIYVSSAGTRT